MLETIGYKKANNSKSSPVSKLLDSVCHATACIILSKRVTPQIKYDCQVPVSIIGCRLKREVKAQQINQILK